MIMLDKDVDYTCLDIEVIPMVNEENLGVNSPLTPVEYICPTCYKRWIDYGLPNKCPYCNQTINTEFRGNPSYYNWGRIDETKILHNPNGRYIVVCKKCLPPLYPNVPYFVEIYGDLVYFYNNEMHDHRIGDSESVDNIKILANKEITDSVRKLAICFGTASRYRMQKVSDEVKVACKKAYKISKDRKEFNLLVSEIKSKIYY